jgi:hypothetical protein
MSELKKALRAITNTDDEVYSIVGKVTKVDKTRRVVNVQPLNGDAEILGVKLQSNESNTEGVVIFPKKGSNVVVTFLNKNTGYVALFSTVEMLEYKAKQLKISVDTEGVHLERNGVDLKQVFDTLVEHTDNAYDFLIKLKVVTPAGPGKLSPDMILLVKAEQLKLTLLKNQISQIIK